MWCQSRVFRAADYSGSSSWVKSGRRVNPFAASLPFALLIAGTLALGFSRAARYISSSLVLCHETI